MRPISDWYLFEKGFKIFKYIWNIQSGADSEYLFGEGQLLINYKYNNTNNK